MEPYVSAHLHPRQSVLSSRSLAVPSQTDQFQSAKTERVCRAVAPNTGALTVLSLLTAYQAELCGDPRGHPRSYGPVSFHPALRRPGHRKSAGYPGGAGAREVAEPSNLSDGGKDDTLEMLIVPGGMFGLALASMQRRCGAKTRENEALHICSPQKPVIHPQPPHARLSRLRLLRAAAPQASQFQVLKHKCSQTHVSKCSIKGYGYHRFNPFLRKSKFRMLTHASLLRLLRRNNVFASFDLKDAYFHIPIPPPHRRFLTFAFQGIGYQYHVLPFGLSLSPRQRLATYLLAQSQQEVKAHACVLLWHLQGLGGGKEQAQTQWWPFWVCL